MTPLIACSLASSWRLRVDHPATRLPIMFTVLYVITVSPA